MPSVASLLLRVVSVSTSSSFRLVLSGALVLAIASSISGRYARAVDDGTSTDRFKVFGDGDALLVPVEIDGRMRSFIVDTGCPVTAFDKTLVHSKARGSSETTGAINALSVELFDPPAARLGRHQLERELRQVIALDLTNIRRQTGHDMVGIVGMDFLRNYVVRINFDEGSLELLTKAPESNATAIDLTFNDRGMPCVRAQLDWDEFDFVLDTGCLMFGSGLLDSRTCQYGEQLGQLKAIGGQHFTDAGGEGRTRVFQANSLVLAGRKLPAPVFQETRFNAIGLHCLSRFNVTLDFPGRKMYMTEGKAINKPDGHTLAGLGLVLNDGRVFVEAPNPHSPGEIAGLRDGDELVSLGGLEAARSRLSQLQEKMSHPGSVEVVARRDGKEFRTTLKLE